MAKNLARSKEEIEADFSHYFCLTVMMTWTDVKIGTQNSDRGMCCAGARLSCQLVSHSNSFASLLQYADTHEAGGVELVNWKLGGSNRREVA